MKEKKPDDIELQNNLETVKCGELLLQSSNFNCAELISLLLGMLENKNLKTYLQNIQRRQSYGNYLG